MKRKRCVGHRSVHQQRNSTQLDRWLAPEDLLDGIGQFECLLRLHLLKVWTSSKFGAIQLAPSIDDIQFLHFQSRLRCKVFFAFPAPSD
jgi:hypothetical protein